MDVDALRDDPLGRLVVIAGQLASRQFERYLTERFQLTPAGMRVILLVGQHGEVSHRELAGHCFVRPATLTGVVDTLAKAGYVERRRDPADRRTVKLALTPAGRARHGELAALISRGNDPLTEVDADPANEAVVREFLLQLIQKLSAGEEATVSARSERAQRAEHRSREQEDEQ